MKEVIPNLPRAGSGFLFPCLLALMGHGFGGLNGLRRPEPLAADDKDGFFSFIAVGIFTLDEFTFNVKNPCSSVRSVKSVSHPAHSQFL